MPGFDGTGPMGQGAMTGGARGYCAVPAGSIRPRLGARRFFGRGGARGRGFRNWYRATGLPAWVRGQSEKDELDTLKSQAAYLKGELDAAQAQIKDLENK